MSCCPQGGCGPHGGPRVRGESWRAWAPVPPHLRATKPLHSWHANGNDAWPRMAQGRGKPMGDQEDESEHFSILPIWHSILVRLPHISFCFFLVHSADLEKSTRAHPLDIVGSIVAEISQKCSNQISPPIPFASARKPSEESQGTTGSPIDNPCPGRSAPWPWMHPRV